MPAALSEIRDGVGVLTLNNPDQLNSLIPELIPDALEILADFEADPSVRAVVLTGAGRGFCSGANLAGDSLVSRAPKIADGIRGSLNKLVAGLRNSSLPVVSAVNGPAAGAGVGIALSGDFVLAARSAKFLLSFVRIGASLDGGASYFLPRLIGPARARQMCMLGEPIDAATAERWGMVYRVVDDAVLMDEAISLASRLAAGPPVSLARIKQALESGWNASLDDALELEATLQGESFATEDLREGVAAYQQKRPAQFKGR